ncbi:MAG TPA: oxidoreductase-like domain-containing protein [Rhodanobacteraceae bacterium]|nr:oxidoreductase-like domain-containing protein [Rhodanobacteraceae bacterium]
MPIGEASWPDDPPPRRPQDPDPADCCGEGCVRCIFDVHDEAMERYETALAAWRERHPAAPETGHPGETPRKSSETKWIAITREVGPALDACELSYLARVAIDVERARAQHRAYRNALTALGCDVLVLPAEPALPDSVFVEDVAVVLDEAAVMTRPGALSRRAEGASVAAVLRRYRNLLAIESPATLDGGDVLRTGRTLHVGESARSNAAGIAQLQALVASFGYAVRGVPTRGCLHLKSAVTQLDDATLLVQPDWVDHAAFTGFRLIETDPDEAHAANVLRIGGAVVMPAGFPRTRQRLVAAGFDVVTVDVSELQKAEGAVTCCSLVFRAAGSVTHRGSEPHAHPMDARA